MATAGHLLLLWGNYIVLFGYYYYLLALFTVHGLFVLTVSRGGGNGGVLVSTAISHF